MMNKEQCLELMRTKTQWYNKSYSGYLFGIALQGTAIAYGESKSPYAIPWGCFFQNHERKDHFDWFWDSELLVQKRKGILDAAQHDDAFAKNFYQEWKMAWDVFLSSWESVAHTNFETHSVDQLRTLLTPVYERYLDQGYRAYIVDTFLNDSKEDWLEHIIKNELGPQATPEVVAALTAPAYESFVNEFEVGKLKIAERLVEGAGEQNVFSECEKLANTFFWIRTNYQAWNKVTAHDVYKEASEDAKKYGTDISKKIQEEEYRISENRKQKSALMDELDVSQNLKRVIEISEIFTHIQDKRKEGVLRGNFLFYSALEAVGKQLSLEDGLIFYLTPPEFMKEERFLQIDWDEIRDRRENGALAILCKEDCFMLSRKEYEKAIPIQSFFASTTETQEVRGSVAFKGLVKGIVRVVRNISEIQNFQEGEVLVANQTTPEYVPAMKKALAFVTDQGGITCHAAIVAREMKKPCIIGTKIATKVLKDGDMVEVDANTGIVRVV